ncbi:MAG: hypothetical protein J2P45_07485 [Candidatus Dormibacteraeota bacterium]|nr:hypothetical protein [Candidatus Dormibacteraeota bacterium]
MALDSLSSRQRQVDLFERYGALLTDRQRSVLQLYLDRDWSLSEIARAQETSRAAVHDLIRRAVLTLQEYELRLGLLATEERRRTAQAGLARSLADIRRRLDEVEGQLEGALG